MRKSALHMAAIAAIVICTLAQAGCGSIATEYVASDRLTYDAIEPEYRLYVESDDTLDADAKALRLATLDSWDYRLSEAEKAGGE